MSKFDLLATIGSAIGFLIVAIVGSCVFATRVFPQEATDWNGPFVQVQQSVVAEGRNDLSFGNDEFGIDIPIYEMDLDLNDHSLEAVAFGYRHELGESDLYLGAKAMVHFGSFTGSESWSAFDGEVGTRVDFSSDTLYTLGVELGIELSPKLLGYIGGGIAAADMTLCGQAYVLEYSVSECANGFAPGAYASLGASYDIGGGWSIGGETQFFRFTGEEEIRIEGYDLGSFEMEVEETIFALALTKTF